MITIFVFRESLSGQLTEQPGTSETYACNSGKEDEIPFTIDLGDLPEIVEYEYVVFTYYSTVYPGIYQKDLS
jgi:hypothetical protein